MKHTSETFDAWDANLEDAVLLAIASNPQGWGDAKVDDLEDAEINTDPKARRE
jgi:hypothetical protein